MSDFFSSSNPNQKRNLIIAGVSALAAAGLAYFLSRNCTCCAGGGAAAATAALPFPLVKSSWAAVRAKADVEWPREADQPADAEVKKVPYFGRVFYKNLFGDHPSLRTTLFGKTAFPKQPHDLTKSLDAVLELLCVKNDMAAVVNALKELGARHLAYGTIAAHYDVVGANALKTLKEILGDEFTPAVEGEWKAVLGVVAKTMIEGAESAIGDKYRAQFAVRRSKEFQAVLAAASSPDAVSKAVAAAVPAVAASGNAIAQLLTAAVADAAAKKSDAPIKDAVAADASLKANRKAVADAISAAFKNAGKLTAYDDMVVTWFAGVVAS